MATRSQGEQAMNQMARPKAVYEERSDAQMAKHLPGGMALSLCQKLALSCRMLANDGHASGLAGQITARGEDPSTFWTQRFGLGLEEMSANNLLLVDGDLGVLEGHGMPNPANRFHIWIYLARPDVSCIIHTHPFWCSALGMLEEPLVVSHMDTTHLHEDCAFLARWPGVLFGDEEGRIISEVLGDKRAVLLAHHGQLVACGSVEEAAVLALTVERAARLHMAARAVGEIKPIEPHLGAEAHAYKIKPASYQATFAYYARRTLITDADCLS
jgi:L-fuculose-phosphate aldolase